MHYFYTFNNNLKKNLFLILYFYYYFVDTLEEALRLIRTSLNSPQMDVEGAHYDQNITHLIVVMGASVCIMLVILFLIGSTVY